MKVLRLFCINGQDFRDLRTGAQYIINYDNNICIKPGQEYFISIDEMNYIIDAVPVSV